MLGVSGLRKISYIQILNCIFLYECNQTSAEVIVKILMDGLWQLTTSNYVADLCYYTPVDGDFPLWFWRMRSRFPCYHSFTYNRYVCCIVYLFICFLYGCFWQHCLVLNCLYYGLCNHQLSRTLLLPVSRRAYYLVLIVYFTPACILHDKQMSYM